MNKRTIQPPPDGWKERVDADDTMIGYITRRMERDADIIVPYSQIRSILKYADDYKEYSTGRNERKIPSRGLRE